MKKEYLINILKSVTALVILNMVLQFLVYPFLGKQLDAEEYGNILYLMGYINIICVSIGTSLNNSRMVMGMKYHYLNKIYLIIFVVIALIIMPITILFLVISRVNNNLLDVICFTFLTVCTIWRYYGDVLFKEKLNYSAYLKYYLSISGGYIIGIIVFLITNEWIAIFFAGEIMSFIYHLFTKELFSFQESYDKGIWLEIIHSIFMLTLAQLMINSILNSDRILLKTFLGGTAVTIYYLASLTGKTVSLLTTPLNSVIIGYLVKKKDKIPIIVFIKLSITIIFLGLCILVLCICGSHILIKILYPQNYDIVKPFFVIANTAQIIFFISGIYATLLLRYAKEREQLLVNIFYIACFVIICIPLTVTVQLWGFAVGILVVNVLRLLLILLLLCKQLYWKKVIK